MHSSTILALILAMLATTLANPIAAAPKPAQTPASGAVSPEIKANVTGQINKWLADIQGVNTFVDSVGKVTDPAIISSMAATAFTAAQGEGDSNNILQQDVKLDASGAAAAKNLLAQFNIIGPAINDTISNPGNLQKNLNAINGARCPPPQGKGAISEEGAVQAAAAAAVGIKVAPPKTPAACAAPAKAT